MKEAVKGQPFFFNRMGRDDTMMYLREGCGGRRRRSRWHAAGWHGTPKQPDRAEMGARLKNGSAD